MSALNKRLKPREVRFAVLCVCLFGEDGGVCGRGLVCFLFPSAASALLTGPYFVGYMIFGVHTQCGIESVDAYLVGCMLSGVHSLCGIEFVGCILCRVHAL